MIICNNHKRNFNGASCVFLQIFLFYDNLRNRPRYLSRDLFNLCCDSQPYQIKDGNRISMSMGTQQIFHTHSQKSAQFKATCTRFFNSENNHLMLSLYIFFLFLSLSSLDNEKLEKSNHFDCFLFYLHKILLDRWKAFEYVRKEWGKRHEKGISCLLFAAAVAHY